MTLAIHQIAPDFTLPSTTGETFRLREAWANQPGILYFYPKNFTKQCTKEACGFRDEFSFFRDLNITVVGISQDTLPSHHKFKKAYQLPFELLSDQGGRVSKLYEARVPFLGMTKRITYLLDAEHRVAAAYENMLGGEKHIREMVAALNKQSQ
ncbi:MAG: peroxiredoxin [Tunicatimonas sp.]